MNISMTFYLFMPLISIENAKNTYVPTNKKGIGHSMPSSLSVLLDSINWIHS